MDFADLIRNTMDAFLSKKYMADGLEKVEDDVASANSKSDSAVSTSNTANDRVDNIITTQVEGKDPELTDFRHSNITNTTYETAAARGDAIDVALAKSTNPAHNQGALVFGQEYLSAFHKKLMAWNVLTNAVKFNIIFSGDSTTAGDSTSSSLFHIDQLIQYFAKVNGFPQMNCINSGHSGMDTEHWNQTYVTQDLANSPDLYIIRWGINDPYYSHANNSSLGDSSVDNPTLDAQRRTPEDFNTSLRAGLQQIRNQKDYTQLSIVLMSPSSTYDIPNGRDDAWHRAIIPYIKQAARDFQCCFIDTYQYLWDSINASDHMDNPYGDGRHIHPNDVMNLWITNLMYDVILPPSFKAKYGAGNVLNEWSSNQMKALGDAPSTYPVGISMHRTQTSPLDFPINGGVVTFKSVDGVVFQFNVGYSTGYSGFGFRFGYTATDTWSPMHIIAPTSIQTLTLNNSWVLYDAANGRPAKAYKDSSGVVHLQGLIKSGTMTNGTQIATIPTGFTPLTGVFAPVAFSGGTAVISIAGSNLAIVSGVTANTWLSLDGISYLP